MSVAGPNAGQAVVLFPLMRTIVTLNDDVNEATQTLAQATGKKLGRVLSEMARQAIQPSRRGSKQATPQGTSRFPVFEVPRGSRVIPASRIQKALDKDGIV
jgi:hypothetical protein